MTITALTIVAVVCAYLLGLRRGRIQGAAGTVEGWIELARAERSDERRRIQQAEIRLKAQIPQVENQREAAPWQ